jgi:hypothetical protein
MEGVLIYWDVVLKLLTAKQEKKTIKIRIKMIGQFVKAL